MAKNSGRTSNPSRIRFVMVEAELADGDIGQITLAIQNALRGPAPVTVQRLPGPAKHVETNGASTPEPEVELEAEAEVTEPSAEAPRPRGPRKPGKTPKVIDIDMKSEMSLAAFAQGKDAGSQHKSYLIAAAWLKEHRNVEAVGPDHMYTCFKSMEWPTNILDFAQPLRELKSRGLFERTDKGMYAINHIGLDRAKKLGSTSGG